MDATLSDLEDSSVDMGGQAGSSSEAESLVDSEAASGSEQDDSIDLAEPSESETDDAGPFIDDEADEDNVLDSELDLHDSGMPGFCCRHSRSAGDVHDALIVS